MPADVKAIAQAKRRQRDETIRGEHRMALALEELADHFEAERVATAEFRAELLEALKALAR